MTESVFAQNPFQQRLLEKELEESLAKLIRDKRDAKTEESLKNAKKVCNHHKSICHTYLAEIGKHINDHGKDHTHWGHVGSMEHVHHRLKDIHDFLNGGKPLPVRTVSEEEGKE